MTAAEVALKVQTELAMNNELLEGLKQGEASAFATLDLSFEQIYASAQESGSNHDRTVLTPVCSVLVCTSIGTVTCDHN